MTTNNKVQSLPPVSQSTAKRFFPPDLVVETDIIHKTNNKISHNDPRFNLTKRKTSMDFKFKDLSLSDHIECRKEDLDNKLEYEKQILQYPNALPMLATSRPKRVSLLSQKENHDITNTSTGQPSKTLPPSLGSKHSISGLDTSPAQPSSTLPPCSGMKHCSSLSTSFKFQASKKSYIMFCAVQLWILTLFVNQVTSTKTNVDLDTTYNPTTSAGDISVILGSSGTEYLQKNVSWASNVTSFSFCIRLKLHHFDNEDELVPLLSYSVPGCPSELFIGLDMKNSTLVFECCKPTVEFQMKINPILKLGEWESFCFVADLETGFYALEHDANDSHQGLMDINSTVIRSSEDGIAVIGRKQNIHGGGYTGSFHGILGHLALTKGNESIGMQDYNAERFVEEACEPLDEGYLLKLFEESDMSMWHPYPVMPENITDSKFCNAQTMYVVLIDRITLKEAIISCQNMHGTLIDPVSQNDINEIIDILGSQTSNCKNTNGSWLWLPNKRKCTSPLCDFMKHMQLRTSSTHHCLAVKSDNKDKESRSAVDPKCDVVMCAACVKLKPLHLTVRRGCQNLQDRHYTMAEQDPPRLKGKTGTEIFWEGQNCKMTRINGVVASVSLDTQDDLHPIVPLGYKNWNFSDITEKCPAEQQLLFSVCQIEHFACHDGLNCVPWSRRCDYHFDCPDRSDEEECGDVIIIGRNALMPPTQSTTNKQTSKQTNKNSAHIVRHFLDSTTVSHIHATISSINVNEFGYKKSRLRTILTIRLTWYDSRNQYRNLVNEMTTISNTSEFWQPELQGLSFGKLPTSLNLIQKSLMVQKLQNKELGDLDTQDVMYDGNQNPLVLVASYTTETNCEIDSWRFPFDTQQCCIDFILKDVLYKEIRLYLDNKKLDVAKSVTQGAGDYDVESASANVVTTESTIQGLSICMTFGHDAHFFVAVIYLPSLFFFFCVYLTLFININRILTRLLLGMLCMVGVVVVFWGTGVMGVSPKSSTVTLMEVWALFIVITGFTIMVLQVIICILVKNKKNKGHPNSIQMKVAPAEGNKVESYTDVSPPDTIPVKINLTLQILVPIVSAIFFLWYIIYVYT